MITIFLLLCWSGFGAWVCPLEIPVPGANIHLHVLYISFSKFFILFFILKEESTRKFCQESCSSHFPEVRHEFVRWRLGELVFLGHGRHRIFSWSKRILFYSLLSSEIFIGHKFQLLRNDMQPEKWLIHRFRQLLRPIALPNVVKPYMAFLDTNVAFTWFSSHLITQLFKVSLVRRCFCSLNSKCINKWRCYLF